ncbi:MAG TPA: amino acid-binding protein, partial [Spirochaetota bacterium]
MPHQVSVFAENKPGKIERVTKILADCQINIRAITLSDAGDYGIIKLLLNNPTEGAECLKNAGITASLKEIIAVRVTDKPGGLCEIA